MKNKIVVDISSPLNDTLYAINIIENFLKRNNILLNVDIVYDYDCRAAGMYIHGDGNKKNRIFVNPNNCRSSEETINQHDWDEPFSPGYCADLTLFGVTIHEFCHLLQYKVYKTIVKDYGKAFPTSRFYLNDYCNNEIWDELAEIMLLYLTNPFLLKMISKEHFDFCKSYFKSPVSCSSQRCFKIYNGFPIVVKEHFKNHWGIVYDVDKQKFVRIDKNGKA